MWVLIAILITGPATSESYELGRYETMTECFYIRENVLVADKAYSGIPLINTQYICVKTNYK